VLKELLSEGTLSQIYAAAIVSIHFPDFVAATHWIVASCFKDQATANRVEENLKKFYEKGASAH